MKTSLLMILALACTQPAPPPPPTQSTAPAPRIVFPDGYTVSVEVAADDDTRQQGLMFRDHLADDRGMIFKMEDHRNQTFWMHNTCIPLDLVYIDDDGTIVGIEENAPTMDDSKFEVGCTSRFVLELNAAWTRKHGVASGQRVKLEGL